jgi:hypothetical protein
MISECVSTFETFLDDPNSALSPSSRTIKNGHPVPSELRPAAGIDLITSVRTSDFIILLKVGAGERYVSKASKENRRTFELNTSAPNSEAGLSVSSLIYSFGFRNATNFTKLSSRSHFAKRVRVCFAPRVAG